MNQKIKYVLSVLAVIVLSMYSLEIKAQEKQNDGTWEETMKFLKDNIDKYNLTVKDGDNSFLGQYNYQINDNVLIVDRDFQVESLNSKIRADLSLLEEAHIGSKGGDSVLWLFFTKNAVEGGGGFEDGRRLIIHFCEHLTISKCLEYKWTKDDDFVKRMENAFQHLAYLAEEKRKESKF